MPELVAIVPSRGRPEAAAQLAAAFEETCTADTRLLFAIDDDDPTAEGYYKLAADRGTWVLTQFTKSMNEALNQAAGWSCAEWEPFAIAFLGDDHRPRTRSWDTLYLAALHDLGTGIVYGDDLLQGRNLATQCAMTSDIIRELGYMAPPSLTHLYLDNFWMSLGAGADCLRYLPDVVVEHVHPAAGKAKWDESYARVNSSEMYSKDEAAFRAHVGSGQLTADIEKVKALRAARV